MVQPALDILGAVVITLLSGAASNHQPNQVAEVELTVPIFTDIKIQDSDKFLNDLMLSPYWGVTKEDVGTYIAKPRSVNAFSDEWKHIGFLYESLGSSSIERRSEDARWSAQIIFKHPGEDHIVIAHSGEQIQLGIYEHRKEVIGLNSFSYLAIPLSLQSEIYLVLRESGKDLTRETTLNKIPGLISEIQSIADAPTEYRTAERYSDFFKEYFDSTVEPHVLKRADGNQGRDTFYGYFRTQPDLNYDGINIKISHPVYCPDEGTRRGTRLRKSEYPGKPYYEQDLIFFLIKDNAVYLPREYDKRFGFFTGSETFTGKIEILNSAQQVLIKSSGEFTGWQR